MVIAYFCLYKKLKQWRDPLLVAQFVKAFHPNSQPNIRMISRVILANLEFQRSQREATAGGAHSPSPQKEKPDDN